MAQYVMFVDESGDHNLQNVDDNFPLFCLCGCIFEKAYYHATARPLVDALKIRFCHSTNVILHSRDVRRQQGAFYFLKDRDRREEFYEALNELMGQLDFSIIAVAILKREHLAQYGDRAKHPYHLGLEFMMERFALTMRRGGGSNEGHIIAESRGRVEDELLKEEFFRLKAEGSYYQRFKEITTLWTEKKRKNIVGLQIADLAAYPIARKILDPAHDQLSFDVLRAKICSEPGPGTRILGYGMKIFPQATFDHYLYLDGRF
ncbi:MAG: DUF3800 domain-containing protein [Desulfobacterales bacterium]|nr:DUF3800 domain-containing protein [Desulfobacterales bacterium]